MRNNSSKTFIFLSLGTLVLLGLTSLYLFSCKKDTPPPEPPVDQKPQVALPVYTYEIVATYPHDPDAFTQGLQYVDGQLYEGTGLEGASNVRRVELTTGKVLQMVKNDPMYFGEGIAVLGDRIYQLTYRTEKAFVYDKKSLAKVDSFTYEGEGWGLTTDGTSLIRSDGTNRIEFIDPVARTKTGSIEVFDADGNPIMMLNELEYVKGEIWANIWMRDVIARIDPTTGKLKGLINLSGLLPEADRSPDADVLNGIAYDAATDRIFVTGKLWPKLFEIRIKPRSA